MKHKRLAKFYCDIEKALNDHFPSTVFPEFPLEKFSSESEFFRFDSKEDFSNFICRLTEAYFSFYNSVNVARARFKGEKLVCSCCHVDFTEVQK